MRSVNCSMALKFTSATPILIVFALTPCPSDLSAGVVPEEPDCVVDGLPLFVPDPHALNSMETRTTPAIAMIHRVRPRARRPVVLAISVPLDDTNARGFSTCVSLDLDVLGAFRRRDVGVADVSNRHEGDVAGGDARRHGLCRDEALVAPRRCVEDPKLGTTAVRSEERRVG